MARVATTPSRASTATLTAMLADPVTKRNAGSWSPAVLAGQPVPSSAAVENVRVRPTPGGDQHGGEVQAGP